MHEHRNGGKLRERLGLSEGMSIEQKRFMGEHFKHFLVTTVSMDNHTRIRYQVRLTWEMENHKHAINQRFQCQTRRNEWIIGADNTTNNKLEIFKSCHKWRDDEAKYK